MAIRFLLDEHLRGVFWRQIRRYNALGGPVLDVARVGDAMDLPLGSTDPAILLWSELEQRILISLDEKTLPGHLADHLQSGHHSPGIFFLRLAPIGRIIDFLVCATYASEPEEWQDRCTFIP